ncbi:translocation/assembly module TamB domain-containing protein [Cognataquiflexum rubidum]|uniref:translocation/assembly module TamB domain-containing protein n=1 Tax=Cognataquiflexum rubidum TaxID=2922273 RepID=UPI001F134B52|nr:translocation/assembly module TamB [Cognataquiflexum rubidum]MCH6233130.1 translocation/assembly module TamB domain-containing protein [Cognataquiflexum rubidum]
MLLLVGLFFFIRSPWGQNIIIQKATSFVSKKTGTPVSIEKLFITFGGNIFLNGLYLEDLEGDTLVYSQNLETGVAIMPLIRDGEIKVSKIWWDGLVANVTRDSLTENFNFNFLIDAFVTPVDSTELVTQPDSVAAYPNLTFGLVELKNFRLKYYDPILGINLRAGWKEITIDSDKFDLNKMDFGIQNILIDNADIFYLQTHSFPPSEDLDTLATSPLPLLALDKVVIQNSKIEYTSIPDGISTKMDIGDFFLSLPEANLEENKILVKSLSLSDSKIDLRLSPTSNSPSVPVSQEQVPFSWPEWWVEVGSIKLENNEVAYFAGESNVRQGIFNSDAIMLSGLNFETHSIFLKDQQAQAVIDLLSFKESSGLAIERLQGKLEVDDTKIRIGNFDAKTAKSSLRGDFLVLYQSLDAFINKPENSGFEIRLQQLETDASEALYFVPELASDIYFKELRKNGIRASGNVSGTMTNLKIPSFDLAYGRNTSMRIRSAQIRNATDLDRLNVDIPEMVFKTKGNVLEPFFDSESYSLPEDIQLTAMADGSLADFMTDLLLETSDGTVALNGTILEQGRYFVKSNLEIVELDLGKILELPDLKPISMVSSLDGQGTGLYDIEGLMKVDFSQLAWADLDLSEIELALSAKDTVATLQMAYAREYIDFTLNSTLKIDTVNPEVNFLMDVKKLNTKTVGITRQDINTKFQISGNVSGNPAGFLADIELSDGTFHLEDRDFPMGDIIMEATLLDTLSDIKVQSDFLDGFFTVNGSLPNLALAMEDYFNQVIVGSSDSLFVGDIVAESSFNFHPTPFIDQLLLADIDEMDTLLFEFGFNSSVQNLHTRIRMPHLLYLNATLDTFSLDLNGDANSLNFDLGFNSLLYSPLNIGKTKVHADFKDQVVNFLFNSEYEEETVINLASQVTNRGDSIQVRFLTEDLIFDKEKWDIPEDNLVTYSPKSLQFQNFVFSNGDQSLGLKNELIEEDEEHLGIEFKNFTLHSILGFLNPENPLAEGIVNGNLIAVNPFDAIGFLADLSVRDFELVDIPLGRLDLKATALSIKEYDFNLALKEGEVDLDVFGTILADSAQTDLDLKVDLNALQMSILEIVSDSALTQPKGYITGEFKVTGAAQEPVYKGKVGFKEAGFLVSQLNTSFTFPNELIELDNSGVYFKNFTIKDALGDDFVINGKVLTEDLTDVGFDLKLQTKGFQVMNSTRADSDLFFGKASVDLDLQIGGKLSLPVVNMQLKVNEGTEVSFIVPEDRIDLVERTGVVIFVNHQDPYDIIYRREGESLTPGIKGYDVRANLKIDPKTIFNLIVDERTNDNLRIQGEADLNMLMNPNGDISLSGRYEVNNGHYEMNLFNLVNRRFELAPGSTVIWKGDPMDATLDLTAIYNIRTSAAELMQAQLSGTDKSTASQFRQVLPFMVYLNIDGELLKPEISFELDLAEQERGAFGGSVYGMIQQINEQEDELTKQVFSLLVLNQFFPVVGNDGSAGGSVNLARSSVSQVLSSQLNALSGKLFGDTGFSLDFDLDSYTDFQTGAAQDRTQLNVAAKQSLMDDRLVISVGGQVDVEGGNQEVNQGDALFGDVSVEYLLDQRGQWRAKAYRKNQFESVIDGQLIITGISFIFNKEFNAFKELWRKSAEEAVKKEENNEVEETEGTMVSEKKTGNE